MTAGTLVLVRHGRTEYNATQRLQGQVDIPLDDVGRWQAEVGAQALLARFSPTAIVSSDLQRAAATAQYLGDAVGLEVAYDARLRERSFGAWEGLTADEMVTGWPDEYAGWKSGSEPTTIGAERRTDVGERFAAAVAEHGEALGPKDVLAVVSHGAAISIAITALLGIDPDGWKGIQGMHNAHWSVLRASGAGATPAWRLTAHNVGPDYPVEHWVAGPDFAIERGSV